MQKEFKETEQKLKDNFINSLDKKQSEIARINDTLRVSQAHLKQLKTQNLQLVEQ